MDYAGMIMTLLGGGIIGRFLTLKYTRQKAKADAKSSELDNVQEAITIWREMAASLKKEISELSHKNESMQKELEGLRRAVNRLSSINNRMVKLLDKITPENLETMVEQIKKIHDEG